jgi:hypothetical protein
VRGTYRYVVGRDHFERRFSIVATTTTTDTVEQMGKSAEAMVSSAQQSAHTAMDYTVKAQEVNTELLQRTTEVWIEGLRKQSELSQDVAQEFFEKGEDQLRAYQDFFGQWGFAFVSFPFFRTSGRTPYYSPFGFWREWTQSGAQQSDAQQSAREAHSDAQRTAWDAQKATARETARVIETTAAAPTTAPTNGSLPIAGYDEKSVGEISARLDTLTVEQLERLKGYERRNKNRETLIREIERRIRTTS